MTVTVLRHAEGQVRVEPLDGRNFVTVDLSDGVYSPLQQCMTSYPLPLIEEVVRVKGAAYVCDEISRDEDTQYVQRCLRRGLFSYISPEDFAGRRVLDFGCGSGSSSMVLARLLPEASVVGIDLDPASLGLARRRAEFYELGDRVTFCSSPDPERLPAGIGVFDYIVLSAVFEHLLPEERHAILPLLWSHLRDGGVLFINQTPYRWFPIESHTSSLFGINYLPDRPALAYARRCSRRVRADESWEELLRRGIRGASTREIKAILDGGDRRLHVLAPSAAGIADHIDLWYRMPNNERPKMTRTIAMYGFRVVQAVTRQTTVPTLTLAIRKLR
jgi:2-polyprenyl-3-methyl-5-hydroxy-6-metoxy-1,4-benzoquinol methylase